MRPRSREARTIVQTRYGHITRYTIDPRDYRRRALAADLADKWVEIANEIPGSAPSVAAAIHSICSFLGGQQQTRTGIRGVRALTLNDVNRWELDLVERQTAHASDAPYRHAVHLFALLRRIDDDTPNTLQPNLAARVRQQTRLHHIRRPGISEFSTWERRRLIRAAKRLVDHELASRLASTAARPYTPPRDVLIALAVLLGFGTGEPPEVLRQLTIDDITPITDARATTAQRGTPTTYILRCTKRRSGSVYEHVIRHSDRLAHWSLTALIELSDQARHTTGTNLLWLFAAERGRTADQIRQVPWTTQWSLQEWVQRHLPPTTDHELLEPPISRPINYQRLRKTAIAREALLDPARYLRNNGRHTSATFFQHYAQSPALRARAGRILVDATTELFDAAVNAPTVISPAEEQALTTAPDDHPHGFDVTQFINGELDGPLAACRNPLDSPHADAGVPCPTIANGNCYSCRNAIIGQRHLPAVLRLTEILHPDRHGNLAAWSTHWEPTYRFLTDVVLPQFDERTIELARAHAEKVYLDPSLRQGLGGPG